MTKQSRYERNRAPRGRHVFRLRFATLRMTGVFLAMTFAGPAIAATAWQPTRPVEIIVSTSPGSGSDRAARFIQKLLVEKEFVRSPVNVVNKPGGQGVIGLTYLTQHA